MKKLFLITGLLLLTCPAWAMRTPLTVGGTPSTSANNFMGFSSSPQATNDLLVRNLTPIAGSIEGLFVTANTAPGGSASYAVTLQKNGSATSSTCTITGAATSCSDTVHQFSVVAGDNFSIKVVPASSPASSRLNVSSMFNSYSGGDAFVQLANNGTLPSTSAVGNTNIQGGTGFGNTFDAQAAPASGTIHNLYVLVNNAPGSAASGKQWVFTVQKNSVDTAVTCTVFETATTCNDTTHSFSVVIGDTLQITSTPTSTPASTALTPVVSLTPAIDGESFIMWQSQDAPSTSADRYTVLTSAGSGGTNATEAPASRISPSSIIVARKLRCAQGAPGTSKSWLFGLRVNNATSALQCTMSGASTSCTDTVDSVSLTLNDIIDFIISPINTPAAAFQTRISAVLFIDPTDKVYGSTLYGSTIR